MQGRLRAQAGRGRAVVGIGVDVPNPFGPQRDSPGNGVKADRGGQPADDEHLGSRLFPQLGCDGPIRVDDIVGEGAEHFVGQGLRDGYQEVVGGWHGQQVGHRAAVGTAGRPEPERRTRRGPVPFARRQTPTETVGAGPAPGLERHGDSLADLHRGHL